MTVQSCPACHASELRLYPLSRRTGRQNFRCHQCGLTGWNGRDELPPPAPVSVDEISVEERSAWFDLKRAGATEAAWNEVLDEITGMLGGSEGKRIYDIGSGDGHFLAVARERGFSVGGNELLEAALEIARDRYDVELDLGDLATLDLPADRDAVTMWCVLAHVPEPEDLLAGCRDLLRPGGVLYLQTPYRCTIDSAALGVFRATNGRASRWVDRRIAQHHWFLHTRRSMTSSLQRLGFTDIRIEPKSRFTLRAAPYLQSLGLGSRASEVVGDAADVVINRGVGPRIVLDVYARKASA